MKFAKYSYDVVDYEIYCYCWSGISAQAVPLCEKFYTQKINRFMYAGYTRTNYEPFRIVL